MTIDIWVPMAIAAGIAAAVLYRRKGALPAGLIVAVPPLLLVLYVVSSAARRTNDAAQAVLVAAAWLGAAGLAALCTSLWLRRPQNR